MFKDKISLIACVNHFIYSFVLFSRKGVIDFRVYFAYILKLEMKACSVVQSSGSGD